MAEFYRYEKYLKYINGVPAVPLEYKQGELIGIGEYNTLSDCESGAIYRWVDNGKTVCKEYSLYNQEKKLKSTDNGVTWTDTWEVRAGNKMIELYAKECGWRLMTRWEKTGKTVCEGGALTEEYIKQESWDMGKTWQNSVPAEYKYELLEEWSKECVLLLDPIVLEVSDGTAVAGGYEYRLPLVFLYNYNYWTQWEENGIIYDHEVDGDNAYSYVYPNKDPHIVKVWGWATELFDREYPYSVISWGSYYGTTYDRARGIISIPLRWLLDPEIGVTSTSFYSDKAATQFARINVGENLVSWVDDTNNILRDNREFRVHNSHITKLPVSTFDNMNTYILDVSDCTNLVEIPPLQEGTERYFGGWHSLRAKNCTSLTKVPDGLYEHYSYRDDFGPDNTREDIIPEYYFGMFNCIEAFKGCTKITELPDKLDITFSRNMFLGCTGLTDISNCTITTSFSSYMFNGCVNITTMPTINSAFKVLDSTTAGSGVKLVTFDLTLGEEPDIYVGGNPYNNVYRSNMFCTTKVTSVNLFKIDYTDPDIPEDFKLYRVGICDRGYPYYFEMFKDCPITTLEGLFKKILHYREHDREEYKPSGCNRMFYNTQLTLIPELFSELPTIPSCSEMFANCNITSISNNFFNYNLQDDLEGNSVEGSLLYMFAGNKLTNYPILNDLPIWRWPNLYKNGSYISTYAFFNNIEIGELVPLEWGGFGGIKPVIIETEATSITISPGTNGLFRVLSDGVLYRGTQTITLPEGTNTIYIYVPDDTTWKVSSALYKILDFGGGGMIDLYSDPNYITYLGTDQGVFKTTTRFPLENLSNVEEVSVDFLKSGTNINSVEELFRYNKKLTSTPDGIFSKLTNLSGADWVFDNSNILNVDGMFEGCTNLISAYGAFRNCDSLVSVLRTFKDCTSLSKIENIFGDNPGSVIPINCNQLFENTAVTTFYPSMSSFLKLSSAIGMFRNNSKLTKVDCKFTLVGDNVDVTEMFKDCSLVNNNDENWIAFKISEGSTANFTRCWLNCAALSLIPRVEYGQYHYVNPWEVPNAVGTECFNGCTHLLEKYGDLIPDGWK